MIASRKIPEDLREELLRIAQQHKVAWLVRLSGLSKTIVYGAIDRKRKHRNKTFAPWVVEHLRWIVSHYQDVKFQPPDHPPPLPLNCQGIDDSCRACSPDRIDNCLTIRVPLSRADANEVQQYRGELLRQAEVLKRNWHIEEALRFTELAYYTKAKQDMSVPQTTEQMKIAAKISELSRRTGNETRYRAAYEDFIIPTLQHLRECTRGQRKPIPIYPIIQVVKELVALENETYAPIRTGSSFGRRIEWFKAALRRYGNELKTASMSEFNSAQRQLLLAAIRQGLPSQPFTEQVLNEKGRLSDPLHYYGVLNLKAMEFFDRREFTKIRSLLEHEYTKARGKIFVESDRGLIANEGERSTMQGMAYYLGIALWCSRKNGRIDTNLQELLNDADRIRAVGNSSARCIVTPAMREAARGWTPALNRLTEVAPLPLSAEMKSLVEISWDSLQGILPNVEN